MCDSVNLNWVQLAVLEFLNAGPHGLDAQPGEVTLCTAPRPKCELGQAVGLFRNWLRKVLGTEEDTAEFIQHMLESPAVISQLRSDGCLAYGKPWQETIERIELNHGHTDRLTQYLSVKENAIGNVEITQAGQARLLELRATWPG